MILFGLFGGNMMMDKVYGLLVIIMGVGILFGVFLCVVICVVLLNVLLFLVKGCI